MKKLFTLGLIGLTLSTLSGCNLKTSSGEVVLEKDRKIGIENGKGFIILNENDKSVSYIYDQEDSSKLLEVKSSKFTLNILSKQGEYKHYISLNKGAEKENFTTLFDKLKKEVEKAKFPIEEYNALVDTYEKINYNARYKVFTGKDMNDWTPGLDLTKSEI